MKKLLQIIFFSFFPICIIAQGDASLLDDPTINEFNINGYDNYFTQAETSYENEDFALATILYTKCIMINPDNSYLYYSRALSMWNFDEPNKNDNFYRDLHLIILDFNQALSLADEQDLEYLSEINGGLANLHLILDDVDFCPYFVLSCEQGNEGSCKAIKDLCE